MTAGTQQQFGYQWNIYRPILPFYREQFCRWIQPVTLDFFKDKSFLDAGCGIGRNSYWPLLAGAKSGYAIDYDERTVAVARENLRDFPNCTVAYQSIYDLAQTDAFDIVFCIGVLHHLAQPRQALENLVRALKPGGTLILWVYAYEGNERYLRWVNPVRKHFTAHLPPALTRLLAKILTAVLKIRLAFPQRQEYLQLLQKMSFRQIENIVLDQLLPSIACYWTQAEVQQLLAGLPLTQWQWRHTNGMSWTVVAQKITN